MSKAGFTTTRSAKEVRERLFRDRPSLKQRWSESEPKRLLALMLVRLRKAANLTQQELAEIAGWDKSFVSRLESANGGMPDLATVERYAGACRAVVGLVAAQHVEGHLQITEGLNLSGSGSQFIGLQGIEINEDEESLKERVVAA